MAGNEKEIKGSVTRQLHYIYSPYGLVGVMIKQGETENLYYAETDQVGSIISLLDSDGSYAEKYLYDAWGRRRNPDSWSYDSIPAPALIDRGFTGQEHLYEFGLINMNGSMYDPFIGRFLGVDPYIQATGNSQSFNGYSYCLNNPLKYSDPSGNLIAPREVGYAINQYFSWMTDVTGAWHNMSGGGGGGGGYAGGHYGTMGSGYYDTGDYTYNTSDVMGSLWNATPNNAYYTFSNVNGDWYHTSTTTITFSGTDPSTLTASLAGTGIAGQEGNISIYFDGSRIFVIDESKGSGVYNTVAYSGRSLKNGSFDYSVDRQKLKDIGPIPEGNYTLDANQIQKISFIDRIAGLIEMGGWPGSTFAWGDTRAWLTPTLWTETYGRSGFSIHGGVTPGSAGCIDLVGNCDVFFNQLQNVVGGQQQVIIRVRYK